MAPEVTDAVYVRSTLEVERIVEQARAEGRMGIDTEFLRERTYFAKLCLVQVSTPRQVYLIDPLGGCDPLALQPALTDPNLEVILHAGRQDLQIFYELSGQAPKRIFDIQLAAAFAGYGSSLPYGRLVEETLGVKLEKGEAYTDWTRRPLTESQLTYAANDVRYLLPAADHLKRQLERLGRLGWVQEEMLAYEAPDSYARGEDELWRKVAGHGTLSERQTAVLRELASWRDEAASVRDLPRGWLVKDPTLLEIARRSPTTISALKSIRGMDAHEADRLGQAILAAVARGQKAPPIHHAPRPPKGLVERTRMLSSLADTVIRARAEAANIAPEMIVTRSEVDALLMDFLSGTLDEGRHRLLHGWRRDMAGEAVLELASGRIALRPLDRPPYIEEIRLGGAKGIGGRE